MCGEIRSGHSQESSQMLYLLFGSQTGCAEDAAFRVERALRRFRYLDVRVMSLEEFDFSEMSCGLEDKLFVFITSTTGQGECPDNMKEFWRLLMRKGIHPKALEGVRFTCFGLGDSSYPIYNAIARKLFQRMLNLGASAFCSRGLGDDQHRLGYDGGFAVWLKELMQGVSTMLSQQVDALDPSSVCIYNVKELGPAKVDYSPPMFSYGFGKAKCTPVFAKMIMNSRITEKSHWQDVRHIEFDVESTTFSRYSPGDVLLLHPENRTNEVFGFIRHRLELDPEMLVSVTPKTLMDKMRFDGPITLLDLFIHYLDVLGTPKRSFFETIHLFATAKHERERLEELASPEEQEDLIRYNDRERRTYIEVLNDFPSVKIPLDVLVDLIPRLRPRAFSISSSALAHPNRIQVTVALVDFLTPFKRRKLGICSEYLRQLNPTENIVMVPISLKRGSFHIPDDISVPLILVGPGTGIAPFRSLCHERDALRRKGNVLGDIMIVFGNRNRSKDYLYSEEWESFLSSGTITDFLVAFSRDQEHKVYVQHIIKENARRVWELIKQGAHIFVAGASGQMPKSVREAFLYVIKNHGGMNQDEADQVLKNMETRRKYCVECWS